MNGPTYKDEPIHKLYCNQVDAAKEFGLDPSIISYWERKFDLNFHRSVNSWAVKIDPDTMQKLREIYFLLKVEGYTVRGARRKLEGL